MSEESEFSDDGPFGWIQWFCALEDHQFLCQINQQYIRQLHNLHGLNHKIKKFQAAIDMILRATAPQEHQIQKPQFLQIYQEATQLYGLIHARYILSPEGMAIMRERFLSGKFGKCPRVLCEDQNVVPIGVSDDSKIARVKIYCPRCKDIYAPKKKSTDCDGSYIGSSFPHILFMTYPDILPQFKKNLYTPTVFGFKIQQQPNQDPNSKQKLEKYKKYQQDYTQKTKSQVGTSAETKNRKKKKNK